MEWAVPFLPSARQSPFAIIWFHRLWLTLSALFPFLALALEYQLLKSVLQPQCSSCLLDTKSWETCSCSLTFCSLLHLSPQQVLFSSQHCIFYLETICISFIKLRIYFIGFMMTVTFLNSHYEYCSGNFIC